MAGALSTAFMGTCSAVQPIEPEPSTQALEHYLSDHGISSVLGAHLRKRMRESAGQERLRVAESLGRLYVKNLNEARTPEDRRRAEALADDLLRLVPESDSFELRLDLAKATYLTAERIAENDRVRLAPAEDKAEAERVLRNVLQVFEGLATKINRKVELLEKREAAAKEDDLTAIREELAYSQRLRSLSRYYAGWSNYYLALLTNNTQKVGTVLEHFGVLLNAQANRPATLDRVPAGNLKYEHVCRAMIGCALALTLKGDSGAIKWIEKLEGSDETPPVISEKLFAYKAIVLAGSGRWSDLEVALRSRRAPDRDREPRPLSVDEARLVAVLGLESLAHSSVKSGTLHDITLRVAKTAMADLMAHGQITHVMSLVTRYGTATIGTDGFIANYVRAAQSYERAYEAHQAIDPKPTRPTSDPSLINQYRHAAHLLDSATNAADADKYPHDRTRAAIQRGLALFFGGELESAADVLQKAALSAGTSDMKRDALWYAIVALDAAVDSNKPSLASERDRLAVLFIQNFPTSEQAARLLLRQTKAELLSREQTLKLLLAVPPGSPVYEASRDRAAALLYAAFHDSTPADRSFAALRFAQVAEEAIALARPRALAASDKSAADAARSIVQNARRLADVLLASPTPDIPRVEAALAMLDSITSYHKFDPSAYAQEIAYRRLQIADYKKDKPEVERLLAAIRAGGGVFALSAEKLMFRRATESWREAPSDVSHAAAVVRHGLVVLSNPSTTPAAAQSLRASIADAAAAVWRANSDETMRDRAIDLDRALIETGAGSPSVLRRYAELAESAGQKPQALDAWRTLLAGLDHSLPDWHEARYHSLRLLWDSDKAAAYEAMRQHRVLFTKPAPEPWEQRLRELEGVMQLHFSGTTGGATVPRGGNP